jgi:hypothetical protein
MPHDIPRERRRREQVPDYGIQRDTWLRLLDEALPDRERERALAKAISEATRPEFKSPSRTARVESIDLQLRRWRRERRLPENFMWVGVIGANLLDLGWIDGDRHKAWQRLLANVKHRDFPRKTPSPPTHVQRLGQATPKVRRAPSRKEGVDPRLKDHLVNLIDRYRHLPLQGLLDDPDGLEIELEKVYVALRAVDVDFGLRSRLHTADLLNVAKAPSIDVIRPATIDDLDAEVIRTTFRPRQEAAEAGELQGVGELFRTHRRLVVLGGPGSGKSTLGLWITLQCARALVREIDIGEPTRVQAPRDQIDFLTGPSTNPDAMVDLGPSRLPIFLPVAHYARELARLQAAKEPPIELIDYLGRDPGAEGLGDRLTADERNACFRRMVGDGRAVIILDGLDELVDRRSIVPRIHKFIRDHIPAEGPPPHEVGGNQILVTSRQVGYELAPVREGCVHYRVEPMTRAAVERFAFSWGAAVNVELDRAGGEPFDPVGLIAQIYDEARPRIRELAANPLLVTILAIVFYRDGHLPDIRVELYRRIIDNLLELWLQREECVRHDLRPQELLAALEPLAADLQQNASRNGLVGLGRLSEVMSPVLAHMRRMDIDDRRFHELRDNLLATIQDNVGLLAQQSPGNYVFLHGTFREFLAARHLLSVQKEAADRIRERLDNALWREPLLLALGLAMMDPHWGAEARTRLLADVLAADDGDALIPRAALTIVAALPDMQGVSPIVIGLVVEKLITAYGRCLNLGSGGRLLQEIEASIERLRAGPYSAPVEQTLLYRLRMPEDGPVVASLLGRLGDGSQGLVEALLDVVSHDRQDLGWPVRRALTRFLTDAERKDRPSWETGSRLAARLPMRHRLLADRALVAWIGADRDWLWLIIALFGGADDLWLAGTPGNDPAQETDTSAYSTVPAALAFDPRRIVTDLQDVRLGALIGQALVERRPARSLLPALATLWSRDDDRCDGEVLVAMAALGQDVAPFLREIGAGPSRDGRIRSALRRFAWQSSWTRALLRRSGDIALRTLPAGASRRDQQDLLAVAMESLLSAGADPRILARAPLADLLDASSSDGRSAADAERWACAVLGEAQEGPHSPHATAAEIVDAWSRLAHTAALRSSLGRSWPIPHLSPAARTTEDRYLAMLEGMATHPPGPGSFLVGKTLGRCFELSRDNALTHFAVTLLLLQRDDDFRAGFRLTAGEVGVSRLGQTALESCVSSPIASRVLEIVADRHLTGWSFAEAVKRALGDADWTQHRGSILFWIAPEHLHEVEDGDRTQAIDAAASFVLGDCTWEGAIEPRRPLVAQDDIKRFSHDRGWSVARSGIGAIASPGRADQARSLLDLAHQDRGEGGAALLKAGILAIERVRDEVEQSELLRDARAAWAHDARALDALDQIAVTIADPWLADRALGRASRLVEPYRSAFAPTPATWRMHGSSHGARELRHGAGHAGWLVWGAIYLMAVTREAHATGVARDEGTGPWAGLLTHSDGAGDALIAAGVREGLPVRAAEAIILDQLMLAGRAAELEPLWPYLEPAAGSEARIATWAEGGGPASRWARLCLAEAGRLTVDSIAATLECLESPEDRLRFRASLALSGRNAHFPTHPRRWSVRRAGAEALNLVARRSCEPAVTQALRSTFSIVLQDVRHDDPDAIRAWIRDAERGSEPARWILRFVECAEPDVYDAMLLGLADSSPAVQATLLEGLSHGAFGNLKDVSRHLPILAALPLEIRRGPGLVADQDVRANKRCPTA